MSSARQIAKYIKAQVSLGKTEIVFSDIKEAQIALEKQDGDNKFTRALDKYGSEVTSVVIKNAPDFTNARCLSELRKRLPKLKSITICDDIHPETGGLMDELKRYVSQGIRPSLPLSFETAMIGDLCNYLTANHQARFARRWKGLSFKPMSDVQFDSLVKAYNLAIDDEIEEIWGAHYRFRFDANLKLRNDYYSGEGFDKSSPWFANGPKIHSDVPSSLNSFDIINLYALMTKLNLWPILASDKGESSTVFFKQRQQLQAAFNDPAVLVLELTPEKICKYLKVLREIAQAGSFEDYIRKLQTSSTTSMRM